MAQAALEAAESAMAATFSERALEQTAADGLAAQGPDLATQTEALRALEALAKVNAQRATEAEERAARVLREAQAGRAKLMADLAAARDAVAAKDRAASEVAQRFAELEKEVAQARADAASARQAPPPEGRTSPAGGLRSAVALPGAPLGRTDEVRLAGGPWETLASDAHPSPSRAALPAQGPRADRSRPLSYGALAVFASAALQHGTAVMQARRRAEEMFHVERRRAAQLALLAADRRRQPPRPREDAVDLALRRMQDQSEAAAADWAAKRAALQREQQRSREAAMAAMKLVSQGGNMPAVAPIARKGLLRASHHKTVSAVDGLVTRARASLCLGPFPLPTKPPKSSFHRQAAPRPASEGMPHARRPRMQATSHGPTQEPKALLTASRLQPFAENRKKQTVPRRPRTGIDAPPNAPQPAPPRSRSPGVRRAAESRRQVDHSPLRTPSGTQSDRPSEGDLWHALDCLH